MSKSDEPVFDEREQELLRQSITPMALDEARIQATVQRAVELRKAADSKQRWRRRATIGLAAAAVLVCFAVALMTDRLSFLSPATNRNAMPATLREALALTQDAAELPRGRVQAAMHKVYRDANRLLIAVRDQEAVATVTQAAVLEALNGPIVTVPYDGDFDALVAKIEKREPLTQAELTAVTSAARASVGALRQLGATHVLHAAEIKLLCNYLYKKADPTPSGDAGDAAKNPDEH